MSGNNGMENLIPIINGLLDACTKTGLGMEVNLPKIVVVGGQSAGKSSVLENFVGRDFLPRGSGIVTRCPLILQLVNSDEEYGKFLHCPDKKFVNFDDIRKEIESETDRINGTNKGISDKPINLRIYSPHVLDITLIDLPGLTRVPIGDQPEDIEHQTRSMIIKYISDENCIILAVTPANIDLANSDALNLAREVDPKGLRTIGVLTKLDLMDEGTNARDILENKVLPLQRGYIGVVNRSQKDIDGKKGIQAAVDAERTFFMNHRSYSHMIDKMGTPYLQRVLNHELTELIRDKMPSLQIDLKKKEAFLKEEVAKYEGMHSKNPADVKKIIMKVIQELTKDFEAEVGNLGLDAIETRRLTSGSKINIIFYERFQEEIFKIKRNKDAILPEINTAIRNIHGTRSVLYTPQMVLEYFTKQQISLLKQPIDLCIELVMEELSMAVRHCTQNIIYPSLSDHLENKITSHIFQNGPLFKKNILSIIDMELSYMNIKHEEFLNNNDAISLYATNGREPKGYGTGAEESDSDANESVTSHVSNGGNDWDQIPFLQHLQESEDLYNKLQSYMAIVTKTSRDMVPKAIIHYIINNLKSFISYDVLLPIVGAAGEDTDEYSSLLQLDENDEENYQKAVTLLNACSEALKTIRNMSQRTNVGSVNNSVASTSRIQNHNERDGDKQSNTSQEYKMVE